MAKVFTQEEREKIKGQVVELVRQSGRETLRQLEVKTGATRYLMSVLARELVASGDVYGPYLDITRRRNTPLRQASKHNL